jgi:hypothetical protein
VLDENDRVLEPAEPSQELAGLLAGLQAARELHATTGEVIVLNIDQ